MQSKILVAPEYGQSHVLEFIERTLPALAEGMARIEVKAAGINPIDARRMTGEFKHADLPQSFGTEYAGVIVEINTTQPHWKVGDAVLGSGHGFTHATVIDVPIANLVHKPENLDWLTAGSLAGAAQTAMTILDEIGPTQSLLIHGASGGVGSITVQLAKERGINVVATASEKNQNYLAKLGATPVVYGAGLTERLKAIHPTPFDASIDMSGNEDTTQASLANVKKEALWAQLQAENCLLQLFMRYGSSVIFIIYSMWLTALQMRASYGRSAVVILLNRPLKLMMTS